MPLALPGEQFHGNYCDPGHHEHITWADRPGEGGRDGKDDRIAQFGEPCLRLVLIYVFRPRYVISQCQRLNVMPGHCFDSVLINGHQAPVKRHDHEVERKPNGNDAYSPQ